MRTVFLITLSALSLGAAGLAEQPRPQGDPVNDPQADAPADVQQAVSRAGREGKHVLVEVGGEWCSWCHLMDAFFVPHPGLLALRKRNYVFVKVNFSAENRNEAFLSKYPRIAGYPHIFILDGDGRWLQPRNTAQLEAGKSYSLQKFASFLEKWGPN